MLESKKQTAMSVYLSSDNTKKYLQSILGERTSQFVTSLTSLAGSSQSLKECDRNSLLACALKATSLELPFDPNLGFAWCVPYKNLKTKMTTATFQIGAKGYIQLALRTGQYKYLGSRDVREGEFLGRNIIGDPTINWLPDEERLSKKVIGYMAGLELINGFTKVIYWSVAEMEQHATRYSQSYRKYKKTGNENDAIWATNFDKMAEKTILKSLISKYGIMSIDMQTAVQSDFASPKIDLETGEETLEYVDNDVKVVEYLTTEQQRELLEKYGAEKINQALASCNLHTLNEVTQESLGEFIAQLEKLN